MRQIFLDAETTGLSHSGGDRVVEIAAVAYEDRQRVPDEEGGSFHKYINPDWGERPMPDGAFAVHGLTMDFLKDKPTFADIADELIAFVRDGEVIIHNAVFDQGFVDMELKRLGKPPLAEITTGIICSLNWARDNKPDIGGNSLNALCRHHGISLERRRDYHGALIDAQLLGDLWYQMTLVQGEMEIQEAKVVIDTKGSPVIPRPANAEEAAAHEAFVAAMEKENGAPPIYKSAG